MLMDRIVFGMKCQCLELTISPGSPLGSVPQHGLGDAALGEIQWYSQVGCDMEALLTTSDSGRITADPLHLYKGVDHYL